MKANLLRELHGWDAFARSATTDGDQVDPVGLSIDIEHALWETDNFREASQRIDGDVICVEVEWRGSGSALEDVYRDFYDVYWRVAEGVQFIRCGVESRAVVFHVISGHLGDAEGHVHFLVFRIMGPRVQNVVERTRRMR